ncbi:hypothetical protein PT974_08851 [Cladobotryum mycophilum]|uniref:Uncharacterized protein n=1 Tax=Cladobotryum mycophilum TaxID=491253 RepID=A0ABR0SEH2_9HYPO
MSHKAHLCSPKPKSKLHRQINDRDHTRPAPPYQIQPSSKSELVHSWLKQVPKPSHNDSLRDNHRHGAPKYDDRPSWHPHGLPLARIKTNHEELDYQSSDLFIKDRPESIPSSNKENHDKSATNFRHGNDPYKRKRRPVSAGPDLAASTTEEHLFEKQPRRKAREDRYQTRKERDNEGMVETVKISRSRKKHNSRKRGLQSSRDVMENFSSDAIAKRRITVSSLTHVVCVDSLAVTDLTFNDIPLPDENDLINEKQRPPKDRSKYQRRKEKELQEESDFFANIANRMVRKQESAISPKEKTRSAFSTVNPDIGQKPPLSDGPFRERTEDNNVNQTSSYLPIQSRQSESIVTQPASRLSHRKATQYHTTGDSNPAPRGVTSPSCISEATGQISPLDIPALRYQIPHHHTKEPNQEKRASQSPEQSPRLKETRVSKDVDIKTTNYEDKGVIVSPRLDRSRNIPPTRAHISSNFNKVYSRDASVQYDSFLTKSADVYQGETGLAIPTSAPDTSNNAAAQRNRHSRQTNDEPTPVISQNYPPRNRDVHPIQFVNATKDTPTEIKEAGGWYAPFYPGWSGGGRDGIPVATPSKSPPFPAYSPYQNVRPQNSYHTEIPDNPRMAKSSLCSPFPKQTQPITMGPSRSQGVLPSDALEARFSAREETMNEFIQRIEHETLAQAEEQSRINVEHRALEEGLRRNVSSNQYFGPVSHERNLYGHQDSGIPESEPKGPDDLDRELLQDEEYSKLLRRQQHRTHSRNDFKDADNTEMASFWRPNFLMRH